MNIKLTNGKKTITITKEQYEVNINHFTARGFKPLSDKPKKIIEKDENVVKLKPKKKNKEKEMKDFKKYWKMAKDNPKVTAGVIIAIVIIFSLVG